MKLSKTSEGLLYTRIGSLLSATSLLAIFVHQMLYNYVIENGGRYPSAGIIIVSLIVLTFGAVLSFSGASHASQLVWTSRSASGRYHLAHFLHPVGVVPPILRKIVGGRVRIVSADLGVE